MSINFKARSAPNPEEMQLLYLLASYFADNLNQNDEDRLIKAITAPQALLRVYINDPKLIGRAVMRFSQSHFKVFKTILTIMAANPNEFATFLMNVTHSNHWLWQHIMAVFPYSQLPIHLFPYDVQLAILNKCLEAKLAGNLSPLKSYFQAPNIFSTSTLWPRLLQEGWVPQLILNILEIDAQKHAAIQQSALKSLWAITGMEMAFFNYIRKDLPTQGSEIFFNLLNVALAGEDRYLCSALPHIPTKFIDITWKEGANKGLLSLQDLMAIYCATPGVNEEVHIALIKLCESKGVKSEVFLQGANQIHSLVFRGDVKGIDSAIQRSKHEPHIENELHQRIAGLSTLQLAILLGYEEIALRLLKAGVTIKAGRPGQKTALQLAIANEQVDVIRAIKAQGITSKDLTKGLSFGVKKLSAQSVAAILEAGADVDAYINKTNKRTALLTCLQNGFNSPVIKTLIVNNADFEKADKNKVSPKTWLETREFEANQVREAKAEIRMDFKKLMNLTFALRMARLPVAIIAKIAIESLNIPYKTAVQLEKDISKLCERIDPLLPQVMKRRDDIIAEKELSDFLDNLYEHMLEEPVDFSQGYLPQFTAEKEPQPTTPDMNNNEHQENIEHVPGHKRKWGEM